MSSSTSPVIILTGASKGLGLAVLKILLSRYNARVTTVSRTQTPELLQIEKQYGINRILNIKGDVGNIKTNSKAVKETITKWGVIDGLIINAGSLEPIGKISDLNLEEISKYSDINIHASLYLIQPSLPYLRSSENGGKIVLVSSGASTASYTGWGLYCMAKAGLNSIARTIDKEEKRNGVSAWAIRPGKIDVSSIFTRVLLVGLHYGSQARMVC